MDGESWPAPIDLPENARANRLMLHLHRWEVCAQGGGGLHEDENYNKWVNTRLREVWALERPL